VRTLVHHLLYEQRWVPPLFEGLTIEQVGEQFEGDLMGDNASAWPGLLASSTEEAHSAVAQAGALDRTVHLSFGDVSGQEYVMQLTADLAIHAWDLARATRQDDTLDPGAVALLLPWTEANADLVAASGIFGSRIDVGPGAPDDVRLWACSAVGPERPPRATRIDGAAEPPRARNCPLPRLTNTLMARGGAVGD
jgi:uncharacterized protein (TIGR03086 family)